MNNVYFIGLPGCGKTTLGRLLAERSGRPFIDLDESVEEAQGRGIKDIFAMEGESRFRDMEQAALEKASRAADAVVATGGGTVLRESNRGIMQATGIVVFIDRPPIAILPTLDMAARPLCRSAEAFYALARERLPIYRACASVILPGAEPQSAVNMLLSLGCV